MFRFAPSPNGLLHLGHALSASTTYACAAAAHGRFLLRMEDIDLIRTREEFVHAIEDDLAWLGLSWERPLLRQSSRFAVYRAAAARLVGEGVLYPCEATRTDIAAAWNMPGHARDPDGALLYPAALRRPFDPGAVIASILDERIVSRPFALRIDMARAVEVAWHKLRGAPLTFREIAPDGRIVSHLAVPERWGDAVIVRKESPASYHLAVVIDDAAQGVTHVTRGRDLFPATGIHRLLQVLLDLPEPVYHHHALLLDPDGRKLAKSAGSPPLASYRAAGADPIQLAGELGVCVPPNPARWGGFSPFEMNALLD